MAAGGKVSVAVLLSDLPDKAITLEGSTDSTFCIISPDLQPHRWQIGDGGYGNGLL